MIGDNVFAAEKVVMGVSEWPPLVSKELDNNGALARLVTETFALQGVEVEYRWAPWRRAYENVKSGTWDSSPGWITSPERLKEVSFSEAVFESYQVFFHLKSAAFDWNDMSDLKAVTIGATIGYNYGQRFQEAEKAGFISVERGASDEVNIKKLVFGRIKIFPLNILTGYDIARKALTPEQFGLLTHHPEKLDDSRTYHLIFSKNEKGEKMRQMFNRGLELMQSEGRAERYLLKALHPMAAQ
ncbi:MAG: transporter substrate-binding domain-containing protein [Hahellaceae bacterium]|nr:transporter substrate-binding domain-containing protein [Hahellaceae bacterium]MCP5210408.1 transporter substrate-binding domain-containing protein [Hahellaceae bacterium]